MREKQGVIDLRTTAPAVGIFDAEGIGVIERATLGERTGLRPDLKPVKTLRGWAGRADREMLPLVYASDFDLLATVGKTEMTLEVTKYRRSTMNIEADDKSRVSRKGHHTSLELTSKESILCPHCSCGLVHPKTFMCNGGHTTETRCGLPVDVDAQDLTIITMNDVANRYEPKVKIPFFDIVEGELVFMGIITLTRRGGSDKAQNNVENWQTIRRRVKGEKPAWGNYNVAKGSFRFGMIAVRTTIDGVHYESYATIAFDDNKTADMTARGVNIQSRGVNLFNREVTE